MMPETYVHELVYRGHPPGSEDIPTFHVILGHEATDIFGRKTRVISGAMTPEQAAAAGHDLPDLFKEINGAMVDANVDLSRKVAMLGDDVEDAKEQAAIAASRAAAIEAENENLKKLIVEIKAAAAATPEPTPAPPTAEPPAEESAIEGVTSSE